MAGRNPVVTMPQLKQLREWRATPPEKRKPLSMVADLLGISLSTAKRAANAKGYYAKVQP